MRSPASDDRSTSPVTLQRDDGGRTCPVRARGRSSPGGRARPHDHRGLRGARARVRHGAEGRRDVPRGSDARRRACRVEPHFMAISRYGDAEESLGRVQILLDVDVDLTGRDVILVEDIVDTGLTSRYLLSVLRSRGAASVELCTLLDKTARRIVPVQPRYAGFECPDALRRRLRPRLPGAVSQPRRHPGGVRPGGAASGPRSPAVVGGAGGLRLPVVRPPDTLPGWP